MAVRLFSSKCYRALRLFSYGRLGCRSSMQLREVFLIKSRRPRGLAVFVCHTTGSFSSLKLGVCQPHFCYTLAASLPDICESVTANRDWRGTKLFSVVRVFQCLPLRLCQSTRRSGALDTFLLPLWANISPCIASKWWNCSGSTSLPFSSVVCSRWNAERSVVGTSLTLPHYARTARHIPPDQSSSIYWRLHLWRTEKGGDFSSLSAFNCWSSSKALLRPFLSVQYWSSLRRKHRGPPISSCDPLPSIGWGYNCLLSNPRRGRIFPRPVRAASSCPYSVTGLVTNWYILGDSCLRVRVRMVMFYPAVEV